MMPNLKELHTYHLLPISYAAMKLKPKVVGWLYWGLTQL